jgi:putative effector of murein hydrolase LrgA (UPF0299 family)
MGNIYVAFLIFLFFILSLISMSHVNADPRFLIGLLTVMIIAAYFAVFNALGLLSTCQNVDFIDHRCSQPFIEEHFINRCD